MTYNRYLFHRHIQTTILINQQYPMACSGHGPSGRSQQSSSTAIHQNISALTTSLTTTPHHKELNSCSWQWRANLLDGDPYWPMQTLLILGLHAVQFILTKIRELPTVPHPFHAAVSSKFQLPMSLQISTNGFQSLVIKQPFLYPALCHWSFKDAVYMLQWEEMNERKNAQEWIKALTVAVNGYISFCECSSLFSSYSCIISIWLR